MGKGQDLKLLDRDGTSGSVSAERLTLSRSHGAVVVLRLNRPERRNAIDAAMVEALGLGLAEAEADTAVRAVLITGEGPAFSSGGDLHGYRTLYRDSRAFAAFLDQFHQTLRSIAMMTKPVVALVSGVTAAGGLELVLACDFAFAARSARIGDAHLVYGQMGGGGVLTLLPRLVGPARARELVLSGRFLTAREALAWQLVNRVVEDETLLDAGLAFAEEVGTHSALAVANAKYVMNAAWADGTGVEAGLRLERERTVMYCTTSYDAVEGLAAFAEKRSPAFVGR